MISRLQFVALPRIASASSNLRDRAAYVPWLRGPLEQLEPFVDGRPLRRLLTELEVPEPEKYGLGEFDYLGVLDLGWPGHAAQALRWLAGVEPRDDSAWPLEPGRLPLYVCSLCADLGCGAITLRVEFAEDLVMWRDFRVEDANPVQQPGIDLSGLGPFTFDAADYHEVLLEPVGVLLALDADEQAAYAEHRHTRWFPRVTRLLRHG